MVAHILAAGVIAAEKMDNIALGLRLLTAASEAKGCEPDRGDALVASASSAVQRASTLIHKRAINKAVEDGAWKLAVKLMELMVERNLKPSPAVWKNVVTCCAKNEKSRKATALLLDWVSGVLQLRTDRFVAHLCFHTGMLTHTHQCPVRTIGQTCRKRYHDGQASPSSV